MHQNSTNLDTIDMGVLNGIAFLLAECIELQFGVIIYTSRLKRPKVVLISTDHVALPHMTLATLIIKLALPNLSSNN